MQFRSSWNSKYESIFSTTSFWDCVLPLWQDYKNVPFFSLGQWGIMNGFASEAELYAASHLSEARVETDKIKISRMLWSIHISFPQMSVSDGRLFWDGGQVGWGWWVVRFSSNADAGDGPDVTELCHTERNVTVACSQISNETHERFRWEQRSHAQGKHAGRDQGPERGTGHQRTEDSSECPSPQRLLQSHSDTCKRKNKPSRNVIYDTLYYHMCRIYHYMYSIDPSDA